MNTSQALHPLTPGHLAGKHPVTWQDQLATHSGSYGLAWGIWVAYLFIPLFAFMGTVLYLLIFSTTSYDHLAGTWFVTMMLALVIGVPVTFYIRSNLYFRGYWAGKVVSPRNYIKGMVLTWTFIELVGLLSILGCLVTGQLAPNIIPAFFAFILFLTQWPNATAMTHTTGNEADPSVFQHPR